MRRIGLLICLGLLFAPFSSARGAVRTETVHFKSGPETVSGYLALPGTPGKHSALVVIQEWWGLNAWVKEQARDFAEQGYVALAPDLYHGKIATTPTEARKLMQSMPRERAIRDLKAAYNFLAMMPNVNPARIGSIGWCMGGGYSLQLAIHEPRLAACVVDYGELPTDPAAIKEIHAPVLGNFGGDDRVVPPSAVHAFEKAMKAAGKKFNAKIFAGAGHAFENPNNKGRYRPEAAREARARTLAFLDKILK